jgi:signal transduction histidine kinase
VTVTIDPRDLVTGLPGGPLSDCREVLAQVAERVVATWGLSPDHVSATVDEIRSPLSVLCDAVARVAAGGDPELGRLPITVPARRLLDAMRRAALDGAAAEWCAEDIVGICVAVERVQEAVDADAAQRFSSRLTGPDALQLVVEVAHDMRSPVASILFLADRLRSTQSGPLTAMQERQLGLIYSAAFGLSALAGDVIELARGGDWLVDQHTIPFSVADILRSVGDIVQPIAEEKGLTVRLTPPDADARYGYPAALNRVLLNLTTNALKFTAEGSVEVAARQRSRTRIEFSVADTGRGIPPQVMATLFDAFRQQHKPGYSFSSAGLGLAICRKLVASMGGELNVDTSDQGTRFSFELELPLASKL